MCTKHKSTAATLTAVALAIILGTSLAAAQAVRATKAERIAKKQEQLAIKQQKLAHKQQRLAQESANRERQLAQQATAQRDEAERHRKRAESVLMLAFQDLNPVSAAFGPNGDLYVSGNGIDRILEYDGRTGEFLREFVSAGRGGLDRPQGLAFGPDVNKDSARICMLPTVETALCCASTVSRATFSRN